MVEYVVRLLGVIILGVLLSKPGIAQAQSPENLSFNDQLSEKRAFLEKRGYHKWHWENSTCSDCPIQIIATNPTLQKENVREFIGALSGHREELLQLYRINGREYNLLAQMAVGILGRESRFFESHRYLLKENFPWVVHLMKVMRAVATGAAVERNSRGPTQIKIVPTKIAEHYGIDVQDLHVPRNAALATMGYLIEALGELKSRIKHQHLDYISESNYVDYLPYIYFGSTRKLIRREAEPDKNLYVREMKKFMGWVEIYERAPEDRDGNVPAHPNKTLL